MTTKLTLSALLLTLVAFASQAQENVQATAALKAHFDGFKNSYDALQAYDRYNDIGITTQHFQENAGNLIRDESIQVPLGTSVPNSALRSNGLAHDSITAEFFTTWFTFPATTEQDIREVYGTPARKTGEPDSQCTQYSGRNTQKDRLVEHSITVLDFADSDASGRTINIQVRVCNGFIDRVSSPYYLYNYAPYFALKKTQVDKSRAEDAAYNAKTKRPAFR